MHQQGLDAVVARMTMNFKMPLRSGDEFVCTLNLRKEGLKYIFLQDIYRVSDEKLVFTSEITTVVLDHGRLRDCEMLNRIFNL